MTRPLIATVDGSASLGTGLDEPRSQAIGPCEPRPGARARS